MAAALNALFAHAPSLEDSSDGHYFADVRHDYRLRLGTGDKLAAVHRGGRVHEFDVPSGLTWADDFLPILNPHMAKELFDIGENPPIPCPSCGQTKRPGSSSSQA